MEEVDRILEGWKAVTGINLRTGPTRSKAHADKLATLLRRLVKEEGGDVDAARQRIGHVVQWLWRERGGTDLAKYVLPPTVCRKFDDYEAQMKVPAAARPRSSGYNGKPKGRTFDAGEAASTEAWEAFHVGNAETPEQVAAWVAAVQSCERCKTMRVPCSKHIATEPMNYPILEWS